MPDNTISTTPDPAELIDHQAIAAADAVRDSTVRASHEARLAFDAATKALAGAVEKADQAASAGTDLLTAEAAVQHAELVLRAAQRRVTAAGTAAADADRVHREAVGRAHRHAAFDAIERRIAACAAAEAADRAKTAAESALREATADLHRIVNLGCPIRGALTVAQYLQTEAAERHFWAANHVDIENHTFWPGDKA